MPDREKILRGAECCKYVQSLNGCPEECPYLPEGHLTCGLDPLLDDVIVLLREQGPVKPKKEDAWPNMITVCGACGAQIPTPGGWRYNYCPTCGRGIKWDA